MPKAMSSHSFPLQGLFPIAKPSGPPSYVFRLSKLNLLRQPLIGRMKVIDAITPLLVESRLFEDPERVKHAAAGQQKKRKKNLTHMGLKIGQGGTLDPLADGVLVMGVNRGTKHLARFIECSKEYETVGMLGASTTTQDAEGAILTTAPFEHITREDIEKAVAKFQGSIKQIPPIYSALKMDGKPLYEYARESKPLPRAIPTRTCQVAVELVDFTPASKTPGDGGHEYRWPKQHLSAEEKGVFDRLTEMVHKAQQSSGEAVDPPQPDLKAEEVSETSPNGIRPASFKLRMTVSSGTYVRSIVNEIGLALGSGAHVVVLTRTRQGEFTLNEPTEKKMVKIKEVGASKESEVEMTGSIPWAVWEKAIADRKQLLEDEEREKEELVAQETSAEEMDAQFGEEATLARRRNAPLKEWEQAVLDKFRSVPIPQAGGHKRDPY